MDRPVGTALKQRDPEINFGVEREGRGVSCWRGRFVRLLEEPFLRSHLE